MLDHERFGSETILNAQVTLSVRQLLDVAPIVRRMMANDMKSSAPRRKATKPVQPQAVAVIPVN
jgi:hypothetical protein